MKQANKYVSPQIRHETKKEDKLYSYDWEFTEYYRGTVEAYSEAEAVEKINACMENSPDSYYDGGDLRELDKYDIEEVK